MNGVKAVADGTVHEFKRRLQQQRKNQRTYLALMVATMLEARSTNRMDLAAVLRRKADRTHMRNRWIASVLGNALINPDTP